MYHYRGRISTLQVAVIVATSDQAEKNRLAKNILLEKEGLLLGAGTK